MNSLPLSNRSPAAGTAGSSRSPPARSSTHWRALLRTDRFSVHPVAMSVTVERVAVLPDRVAALVADQVDLHEARHRVVPLRPVRIAIGVLQQRAGLGVPAPAQHQAARAGASRRSIVAGDIATSSAAVASSIFSSSKRRSRTTSPPARRQPLARRRTQHRPAELQRHHHFQAVGRGRAASADHPSRSAPQALRHGFGASQSSRTTRPRSGPCPPCSPGGTGRDRLRHCLPLAHRQPHDQDLPAGSSPARRRAYARIDR